MTGPGGCAGSKTLTADASDGGAGVYQLVGYVNGVEIGRVSAHCDTGGLRWNLSPRLDPLSCRDRSRLHARVDTAVGSVRQRREPS